MKTKPADIGHVAPSYEKPKTYNTLVIRPEYRLSLRLGEIERLFLNPPNTTAGRMERLQVLGLFYFPLKHAKATAAFNGEAGARGAWEYFKKEIVGSDKDDEADKEIQKRLKEWVVQRCNDKGLVAPYAGGSTATGAGELPLPAEENDAGQPQVDAQKGHFAKIRVPGGHSYIYPDTRKFHPNHDGDYSIPMDVENMHQAEEMCLHDNPVLGAIPLIATLEKRNSAGGEWKPVEDAMIYFQLVHPYDLPAYDNKTSPRVQLNRPPLRVSNMQTSPPTAAGVGPAKLDNTALAVPDATDPQQSNCSSAHGGKRTLAVADNIFELKVDLKTHKDQAAGTHDLKDRPGFYAEHANATRKTEVKGPFFNLPEAAPAVGNKHKHAVRAKTDKNGEAGVIFRPSLKGGDRYRIRVYLGPPTQADGDGTGPLAVKVETGTFVIWRNIRISRVLSMPCQNMVSDIQYQIVAQTLGDLTKFWHVLRDKPKETCQLTLGVTKKDGTFVGYHEVDLSPRGDSSCAYDGFIKQLARAFCEVAVDPGAETPRALTNDEWKGAIKAAIDFVKVENPAHVFPNNAVGVDIDELVIDPNKTTSINVTNSFVLIPLRSAQEYNKKVGVTSPKAIALTGPGLANAGDFDTWFDDCLLHPFAHYLAQGGYLPGLTLLQTSTISTWHATNLLGDYSIGLGYRICMLRGGRDLYPYAQRQVPDKTLYRDGMAPAHPVPAVYGTVEWLNNARYDDYGYSALLAHEWGHCLFHTHAPPQPSPGATTIHDPTADGYCVMTYLPMEGHFCAKCLFALRGWSSVNTI